MSPTSERLLRLPKAELHVHLDGSLRTSTMVELAAERGVQLPTDDPVALYDYMVVENARNLYDYLDRFHLTLALMQDADGIERVAYELVEDHANENVRYVEVRFKPMPRLCYASFLRRDNLEKPNESPTCTPTCTPHWVK